uniref:Ion_trans domain-containing protein n=1 Tax=Brugia timori TaxID=42155 RepID=A0A0R3QED3_9BILA
LSSHQLLFAPSRFVRSFESFPSSQISLKLLVALYTTILDISDWIAFRLATGRLAF